MTFTIRNYSITFQWPVVIEKLFYVKPGVKIEETDISSRKPVFVSSPEELIKTFKNVKGNAKTTFNNLN